MLEPGRVKEQKVVWIVTGMLVLVGLFTFYFGFLETRGFQKCHAGSTHVPKSQAGMRYSIVSRSLFPFCSCSRSRFDTCRASGTPVLTKSIVILSNLYSLNRHSLE